MDPLTQGVLGAVVAQSKSARAQLGKAAVIGALAAMAPDLDVLIISAQDPLLKLQYHRQFTHSLLFIPFGGMLCALLLHAILGRRWALPFKQILLWSVLGYASHGLLDGCTSYGTQLLWPLMDHRFSWDVVSIIDPLFTLPLLVLAYCAARFKQKQWAFWAIAWGGCYIAIGFVQHQRAVELGRDLAAERGHQVLRMEAKPSFANLLVWKLIYETDSHFYVDAVKPGLVSPVHWPGERIRKLDIERDFPALDRTSQQALDIERFRVFSAGFLAVDPLDSHKIIDIRYSMLPQQIAPLWGIELAAEAEAGQHVRYYTERGDGRESLSILLAMLLQ